MISAGDFRNGVTIEYEGNIFQIIEFQHVKPGKGAAFVRTKLKNIISGGVVEKTFRPTEKCPTAHIDRKDMQYLYADDDFYHFMDVETYDQIDLTKDSVGDSLKFVKENEMVKICSHKGNVFAVEPPLFVELTITETEPGFKGDTATGATKPAVVETGATVYVPLFVEQEDVITTFEGMAKHLFKVIRNIELTEPFPRMPWSEAMRLYGSDKPDIRFGMQFVELMDILKGPGFSVFDNATYIGGICAEGAAGYTRKQLDALTELVKKPQIGAKGMVYARIEADGTVKSSVDKFYTQEVLQQLKEAFGAKPGDLILISSGGDVMNTRKQLCE